MAEGEEKTSGGGDSEEGKIPLGFRFHPTLTELVEFYLLPKLQGRPTVPNDAIIEADAYECDPEILTRKYKEKGQAGNWYFLSPRTRKYGGGTRPARRTGDDRGRWKPSTGQSKPGAAAKGGSEAQNKVLRVCGINFTENTLAYHLGTTKRETKTKWLMQELTVPEYEIALDTRSGGKPCVPVDRKLDKYVVCRIYKSPLRKWIEGEEEEGSTSSASACEEVPTSSQSAPSVGETAAPTLWSRQPGKRPAVEQPRGFPAAPNKRAAQPTLAPGPPAPTHGRGGGGMRVPVGVGAPGCHGVPGHPIPAPTPWPPVMHKNNGLHGPVLRPPLMCTHDGRTVAVPYNGQAPVQGLPVSRAFPPHRAAAAAPNSLGRTTMMRPPNLGGGRPAHVPPVPRPPRQPNQDVEMDDINQQRVFAQLIDAMKAQQQRPTASTQPPQPQPWFDAGVHHPARANAMAPCPQFAARHNCCCPYKGGQRQQQSRCSAIPAASVPGGTAAPAQATPASYNARSKLLVPGDANEGSGNGDRHNNDDQIFADLATMKMAQDGT